MASDTHFYGIPQHQVARNSPKKGIFVGSSPSHQISVGHFSPKFPQKTFLPDSICVFLLYALLTSTKWPLICMKNIIHSMYL